MRRNPERIVRQFLSARRDPEVDARKTTFAELNEYVISRSGWVTSVPADVKVTVECLPDSTLPDELRARGYDVQPDGEGQRIIPGSIIEQFSLNGDGELVPWIEGKPVAEMRTHAGICRVKRYGFSIR